MAFSLRDNIDTATYPDGLALKSETLLSEGYVRPQSLSIRAVSRLGITSRNCWCFTLFLLSFSTKTSHPRVMAWPKNAINIEADGAERSEIPREQESGQ